MSVVDLNPWVAVDFEHFSGVRHRNGPWTHIFLKKSGFEINVEQLGLRVDLTDNAIVFLPEGEAPPPETRKPEPKP